MVGTRFGTILRDIAAVAVVVIFMLPLFWWGLTSFKPSGESFEVDAAAIFNFTPTLQNYAITVMGEGPPSFDSRKSLGDSSIVALTSSLLTVLLALPGAYALSVFTFRHQRKVLYAFLLQRFLPPIALVIPMLTAYHRVGLLDKHVGVALAHTALNLPFAILLLKSFFDDIPTEVRDAAKIDGANEVQVFWRICVPAIRGGIAATAIFAFIFSWIEFMMALFLTFNIRLLPVQASILTSSVWGIAAALTTTALIPAFIFLMFAQRHLVRGLTFGLK
jgi:multiple sugar transport system permease protein